MLGFCSKNYFFSILFGEENSNQKYFICKRFVLRKRIKRFESLIENSELNKRKSR